MCGAIKPPEQFNYKYKSKGIRQKHCNICSRAEIKRHYLNNRHYYLEKARKRNLWYREMQDTYILGYFESHPCVDCGESDMVVLEFDHVRGNKYGEISRLRKNNSIERLKEEIAKCEVRCANCHRRKTMLRLNGKIGGKALVAQRIRASRFGREGWGVDSLRGHRKL